MISVMTYDPTNIPTDQLIRRYRFLDLDRGTKTADQASRHLCLCQKIADELKRRGVDPYFCLRGNGAVILSIANHRKSRSRSGAR